MSEKSNGITRKRSAQLSVRINSALYQGYKDLLDLEGISMTNDIENYISHRLGKTAKVGNVIDITEKLLQQQQEIEELKAKQQEIEELKAIVGELKADWPQKTSNSKAS